MEYFWIFIIVVALALFLAFLYRQKQAVGSIIGGAKKFIAAMGPREGLEPKGKLSMKSTLCPSGLLEAVQHDGFEPIGTSERSKLSKAAKELGVDESALIAARNILVSGAISSKVDDTIAASDKIAKASAAGKTILEIAHEYKLPPVMVARQMLLASGMSKGEAREILQGETPEAKSHPLREQIDEASAADSNGKESFAIIRAEAEDFEKKVAAFLKKNKVDFLTEEQLREAQIANPELGGKPKATPDFFFKTPIVLNDKPVNWIEVKNYPLFAGPDKLGLFYKKNAGQVAKYTRHFGRGAIVFNGGIVDSPAAVLKDNDGKPLDVDMIGFTA